MIKNTLRRFEKYHFRILRENFPDRLFSSVKKSSAFVDWLDGNLVELTDRFVRENNLTGSVFVAQSNRIFKTNKFGVLMKRWCADYLFDLLCVTEDYRNSRQSQPFDLVLEDTPINRFAILKYESWSGVHIAVVWKKPLCLFQKIVSIFICMAIALYRGVQTGVTICLSKKRYKVMREALWGLQGIGGYFFHDDFIVDNRELCRKDLLLFSRSAMHQDSSRMKAYHDARNSECGHFYLPTLPIGIIELFNRIIRLYVIGESLIFFREIGSSNFLLCLNVYYYFINYAVPYEKIFSHYRVSAELGHNYFSANHILEAIVCQNYGVAYYLMHWSDNSVGADKYLLSFLGCDKFFLWGESHLRGVEGDQSLFEYTGYYFKKAIRWVRDNRDTVLSEMGVKQSGKVISFFDESFGGACLMTDAHFVNFWATALTCARQNRGDTVIIKPKGLERYKNLRLDFQKQFLKIKAEFEQLSNAFIIDASRWSFIETIGVADVVVTQGMTSSATIALICGVEGLYLDEAKYRHPFSQLYAGEIVFNDSAKLLRKIRAITRNEDSPLRKIPRETLRKFDAYDDDNGIDRLRSVLVKRNRGENRNDDRK